MFNEPKGDIKENYAYILDYLPHGYPNDKRPIHLRKPLAHAIGEKYFILLELSIKENVNPVFNQKVVVGKENRDVFKHVNRRLKYEELTDPSKNALRYTISRIVKGDEKRFIGFYNDIPAVSKILPGKSKYVVFTIFDESRKQKFKDFNDVRTRVKGIGDPASLIIKRIENELTDKSQRKVLTR